MTKCLSVNNDKSVVEMRHHNASFIVKFHDIISSDDEPESEWRVFSSFNNSGWSVDYYGCCGGIYAVEAVVHLAGEIYGTTDDVDDLLGLPDMFDPRRTYSWFKYCEDSLIFQYVLSGVMKISQAVRDALYTRLYQHYSPSTSDRVQFIKQALLMLKNLALSTNSQVLLCDFHLNNLGITKDKTVKVIDGDHLLTIAEIKNTLSNRTCATYKECQIGDYDDCYSSCDDSTGRCGSEIRFTNLKNMCDIFGSIVLSSVEEQEWTSLMPLHKIISQYASSNAASASDELSRIEVLLDHIEKLDIQ